MEPRLKQLVCACWAVESGRGSWWYFCLASFSTRSLTCPGTACRASTRDFYGPWHRYDNHSNYSIRNNNNNNNKWSK